MGACTREVRAPGRVELVGVADPIRARAEELATKVGSRACRLRQAMSARRRGCRGATERHLEVAGACLEPACMCGRKSRSVNLEEPTAARRRRAKSVVLQVATSAYNAAFGALAARMRSRLHRGRAAVGFKQRRRRRRGARLMITDLDLALSLAKAR